MPAKLPPPPPPPPDRYLDRTPSVDPDFWCGLGWALTLLEAMILIVWWLNG